MSEAISELPENWKIIPLVDSVDILDKGRKPINAKERQKRIEGKRENDLFPYFGATGQVGWIDDFLFNEELILLGEDGAPFLDYSKDIAFMIKGKTWVNNHAHVLRGKQKILDNRFLMYYLNTFNFNGYVTGTTRLKLNQTSMKKIPIKLAPLDQQQQIVQKIEELFSKLDAGVAALNRTKVLLEKYRQSVLKAAMEGELTKDWREQQKQAGVEIEPASMLLEKILKERRKKWEEQDQNQKYRKPFENELSLDKTPKTWLVTNLDTISAVRSGITKGRKKKKDLEYKAYPYLRVANVQDNYLDLKIMKEIEISEVELERYRLILNDILFCEGGDHDKVGRGSIWKNEIRGCIHQNHIHRARVLFPNIARSEFINLYSSSDQAKQYFLSRFKQTTGIATINQTNLRLLPVPIPPIEEQNMIIKLHDQFFSNYSVLKKEVEKMQVLSSKLKQSILKHAFEGKLFEKHFDLQVNKLASKSIETTLEDYF